MSRPTKSNGVSQWSRLRSPLVAVPIIGMIYIELVYLVFILFFAVSTGGIPFFVVFWAPFMILMPVAIFAIWRKPRIGYVLTTVMAVLALALFGDGGHGVEIYATPSSTYEFFETITDLPIYVAVLLYSILGILDLRRRTGVEISKMTKMIPRSSFAAFLVAGFIIGGLVVGLMAGATESRLLQNGTGDIVIVSGAGQQNNAQFYSPALFTAKVGHAISWANRDSTAHTVTSDSGAFDSGDMAVGASYQFTFSQAGNYTYHCTYHAWMMGKVTVTP